MATVRVTVTPTGGHGNNGIDCDLSGPDVVDNAIFLNKNEDSTIEFTLVPGNGVSGWGRNGGFSASNARCPKGAADPPGHKKGQFTPQAANGNVLTVDAVAAGKKGVAYYSLHFDSGSCDPIIINS